MKKWTPYRITVKEVPQIQLHKHLNHEEECITIPWRLDTREDELDLEIHGCGCGCGCGCDCDCGCDDCSSCGCSSTDTDDDYDEDYDDGATYGSQTSNTNTDTGTSTASTSSGGTNSGNGDAGTNDETGEVDEPGDPLGTLPDAPPTGEVNEPGDPIGTPIDLLREAGFDIKQDNPATPDEDETAIVSNLTPEILETIDTIGEVFNRHGVPVTVTSGTDGDHGEVSWHYSGDAIDLRGHHITVAKGEAIETDLREALPRLDVDGGRYDVLFETYDNNPANNHFHIEFDRTIDDNRAPTQEDPSRLRDPSA